MRVFPKSRQKGRSWARSFQMLGIRSKSAITIGISQVSQATSSPLVIFFFLLEMTARLNWPIWFIVITFLWKKYKPCRKCVFDGNLWSSIIQTHVSTEFLMLHSSELLVILYCVFHSWRKFLCNLKVWLASLFVEYYDIVFKIVFSSILSIVCKTIFRFSYWILDLNVLMYLVYSE